MPKGPFGEMFPAPPAHLSWESGPSGALRLFFEEASQRLTSTLIQSEELLRLACLLLGSAQCLLWSRG